MMYQNSKKNSHIGRDADVEVGMLAGRILSTDAAKFGQREWPCK